MIKYQRTTKRSESRRRWAARLGWSLVVLAIALSCRQVLAAGGELRLIVLDAETGQPVACRMTLRSQNGKPRLIRTLPHWHDHFVLDGRLTLKLPRGTYEFEIERGPEYVNAYGHFEMLDNSNDEKTVELKRGINMAAGGWWSGDFDVRRPTRDLKLLMQAEDLHVLVGLPPPDKKNASMVVNGAGAGPVQFDGNRFYDLSATLDQRDGGPLLLFGAAAPLDPQAPRYAGKAGLQDLLAPLERAELWVDVPQPSAWDLPLWLAAGVVDSIELANRDLGRPPAAVAERAGMPRDRVRFAGPRGAGLWSQFIYYQALNAGFRIPPTAGSGSGESHNPVGCNRLYVYAGDELSYEGWWEGLRAGRVVVTNGPLIQPIVAGKRPGHVFRAAAGQALDFDVNLNLTTRDPISYLEIVKNGQVEEAVRIDEWARHGGRLPALSFDESGWFLVRAVTDVDKTYRFASTGPYYVEIGDRPHISRGACQFFLDWLDERIKSLSSGGKASPSALAPFDAARAYWQRRLDEATAE